MPGFLQDPPQLGNQYLADSALRRVLGRKLPAEAAAAVETDLERFGQRVVEDIAQWGDDASAHEPRLVQFDPWGRRIDRIDVARGWTELDRISAEEGLVAIGYERTHGPAARLHQFAKLYLFGPASATYTCPLAMTDGAARLIEVLGDDELKRGALARLTSRDPEKFWTSGQWMTERTGGSDVGRTETIARAIDKASSGNGAAKRGNDGAARGAADYRLFGDKWFTSATTAQMAFTLARIEDAAGNTVPGSRGLSLFYVETRDAAGRLNQIEVLRLKDKLGTRSLPTAELRLIGAPARLVGEPGRGVPNIATLVNVTRVYNAVCSVAGMRRGLALARDYARRREVFGKLLAEQPLHVETLAQLEVEFQAALWLVFRVVELLGRDECGVASEDERAVLRLLTPLAKLYTARQTVASASEVLEAFGGAGYVEDTGLPRLLRDAQVLSIWEGTTNVLSLDALRAIDKEQSFEPLLADIARQLERVAHPQLQNERRTIEQSAAALASYLPQAVGDGLEALQAGARSFAFGLARTYMAALLLEQAQWELARGGEAPTAIVARRWCRQALAPVIMADAAHRADSRRLALDEAAPSSAPPAASNGNAARRAADRAKV
ncbi:MAG: acyl-CoA dehydrogenase family protein [Pirellulales bacterium]|nr:acyl-CoA dehydrogenase family protein [Pirellulales bacterium]